MPTDMDYVKHLDNRVSKLETHVATIGTEVTSVKDSQKVILSKLDSLSANQASLGKVSWPLIVSIGGFVVTLGALCFTGVRLVLGPITTELERTRQIDERMLQEIIQNRRDLDVTGVRLGILTEDHKKHVGLENHPYSQTYRLEHLEKEIDRINIHGSDVWKRINREAP